MPGINDISHEILRDKHRLSPIQINGLLGFTAIGEDLNEKLRGLELVREFFLICEMLSSHNISFIPFKGPVLSCRTTGDAVTRSYHDLDLLLDIEDISRSVSLLKESGFECLFINWPDSAVPRRRLARYINHVTLLKHENNMIVELHWRLIRTPAIRNERFNVLVKNNLTFTEFGGRNFTVLNCEMDLLYLIIHGGLHSWSRLKWLVDIKNYLKTGMVDWIRFRELVALTKAEKMVGLCNKLYSIYFPDEKGIPIEYPVKEWLVDYSLYRIKLTGDESVSSMKDQLRLFRFTMSAFPGMRYKLKEISAYLFVSFYYGRIGKTLSRVMTRREKYGYSEYTDKSKNKVIA